MDKKGITYEGLLSTSNKMEEIIKGNNKKAFIGLMVKVISAEEAETLTREVEERGLPKRIIAPRIEATIIHAAFRAVGITLIEIFGTPHLPEGSKIVIDWNGDALKDYVKPNPLLDITPINPNT